VDDNYQTIVIGAGAAGMMAAGRAAEQGTSVLLLEKMERPGKKIFITGNGRCNITNSRDMDRFIDQFGPNGRFLYNAFKRFFRDDLLALLRRYGVECKTGLEGKIFPATNNARHIVRAFERYMADGKVTVQYGVKVTRSSSQPEGHLIRRPGLPAMASTLPRLSAIRLSDYDRAWYHLSSLILKRLNICRVPVFATCV
jgi:predicted Rossmann fold flavoprotein